MKKKNKILLILCSIFVCIASVLSFLPFAKDNDRLSVYADSTINTEFEFNGNNYYMFVTPFDSSDSPVTNNSQMVLKSYDFFIDTSLNVLYGLQVNVTKSDGSQHFGVSVDFSYDSSGSFTNNANLGDGTHLKTIISFSNFVSGVVTFGIPVKVNISSVMTNATTVRTRFIYYDADGNFVSLSTYGTVLDAPSSLFPFSNYLYNNRTYYFTDIYDFTDNEYYNQGYSAGQSAGYNDGYNKGQTNGYSEGYNVGENVGYNNGYNEGIQDSNQYTFLNLISATIDAPVTYFQSLFNFELLGVNLQGFLTGLFTLCVIVTIIRLCLGGV